MHGGLLLNGFRRAFAGNRMPEARNSSDSRVLRMLLQRPLHDESLKVAIQNHLMEDVLDQDEISVMATLLALASARAVPRLRKSCTALDVDIIRRLVPFLL